MMYIYIFLNFQRENSYNSFRAQKHQFKISRKLKWQLILFSFDFIDFQANGEMIFILQMALLMLDEHNLSFQDLAADLFQSMRNTVGYFLTLPFVGKQIQYNLQLGRCSNIILSLSVRFFQFSHFPVESVMRKTSIQLQF